MSKFQHLGAVVGWSRCECILGLNKHHPDWPTLGSGVDYVSGWGGSPCGPGVGLSLQHQGST